MHTVEVLGGKDGVMYYGVDVLCWFLSGSISSLSLLSAEGVDMMWVITNWWECGFRLVIYIIYIYKIYKDICCYLLFFMLVKGSVGW